MPSREKIAGWLKKEGDSTVKIWADLIGTERANEKAAIWYNRAAQVENMRCENCECFDDTPPTGCLYPWDEFDKDGASIDWCGSIFGCWHFKLKVKED